MPAGRKYPARALPGGWRLVTEDASAVVRVAEALPAPLFLFLRRLLLPLPAGVSNFRKLGNGNGDGKFARHTNEDACIFALAAPIPPLISSATNLLRL